MRIEAETKAKLQKKVDNHLTARHYDERKAATKEQEPRTAGLKKTTKRGKSGLAVLDLVTIVAPAPPEVIPQEL
eukprot:7562589-Karenia_brevis.AAC.1